MTDRLDNTFNLKHRLVGAIVLIGLAVILLPRVLTGTDPIMDRSLRYDSSSSSAIKPSDILAEKLEEYSEGGDSENINSEVVGTNTIIEIEPLLERNDLEDISSSKASRYTSGDLPEYTNPEIKSPVSEAVVTGWISQVGVFENKENATKLILELENDGISGQSETVVINGRTVTRVWVGPFSRKEDALREGTKAMLRSNTPPVIKKWP
ncbi:MAG: hypothetical protein CL402_09285 [Acidiferrobacteraceae bacterium]|nr:hypothetical protein [Acidiferrobacteraceae bacterium]|tara:strand:- start:17806 stop:18432 length:627 start_codon:yes stop_codon:yes gene_type:complete